MDSLLPKNVHIGDRIFRLILGLFVISLAFWGPKTNWGWLGAIFVLTGMIGSCPIYRIFGFSTLKK